MSLTRLRCVAVSVGGIRQRMFFVHIKIYGMEIFDIVGAFGKVLDKIIPDKAQRDAYKLQLAQLAQQGDLDELKMSYDAIVAEAQSADKWTSRARPSFMYVFYILLLLCPVMGICYAVSPSTAANVITGFQSGLAAIPDIMWQTFGVGYVGYSAARSWEKYSEIKHGKK